MNATTTHKLIRLAAVAPGRRPRRQHRNADVVGRDAQAGHPSARPPARPTQPALVSFCPGQLEPPPRRPQPVQRSHAMSEDSAKQTTDKLQHVRGVTWTGKTTPQTTPKTSPAWA
jgi:hypothetical protein